MNKTDKIVISLILVFAIIMGLVQPIKSFATVGDANNPVVYAENYNAELETNSNTKTEFKFGKILQSNGNLWEITKDAKLNKIDTNVSDCYFYEGQVQYALLGNCILYNDNKLKIEGKWLDKETREVVKTNNVNLNNVKKILYKNRGYFNYLDSNNNIYQIDCFGEKSQPVLLASNVKNCWEHYYTKDGITYRFNYEGTEIEKTINEEIKDEYNYYWVVNLNNCLCRFYNNMETFKVIDTDFKEFVFKTEEVDPVYYNKSNQLRQAIYNSDVNEYIPSDPTYGKTRYDWGKKVVFYPNGDIKYLANNTTYYKLSKVVGFEKFYENFFAIRSDGTVWALKSGENEEFNKILGSSSSEQHTHTWDNGKVTKAATCISTGVKTYTCTGCSETKTETIAKIAHSYKTTTTKATLSKDGSIVEKCSVCGNVKTTTPIYYPKTISLSKTSFTYNKKVQKPTVTVKDSKGKVIASSNYTVTYSNKNSKKVGRYSVTIKFKGNYEGTKTLTYDIKPKGVSISKLTKGSKQFKATWGKNTTETTGYELQYATNSKFTSGKKTVNIKKNKATSITVKKLKNKKKYYVSIRTYKTVKFNGKSIKIYSGWSKVKNVKTK